jgi:hypothetical protein
MTTQSVKPMTKPMTTKRPKRKRKDMATRRSFRGNKRWTKRKVNVINIFAIVFLFDHTLSQNGEIKQQKVGPKKCETTEKVLHHTKH